jgi:hypothetical protein
MLIIHLDDHQTIARFKQFTQNDSYHSSAGEHDCSETVGMSCLRLRLAILCVIFILYRDVPKLAARLKQFTKNEAYHNSAREQCCPGTGTWFFSLDEYLHWINNKGEILWCTGDGESSIAYCRDNSYMYKAGAGKTIMTGKNHCVRL